MISKEFGEVIWLWTILFKGKACHPYNVGSDQAIFIAELAETVAETLGGRVKISSLSTLSAHPISSSRYVPDTDRIMSELSLAKNITLKNGDVSPSKFLLTQHYYAS